MKQHGFEIMNSDWLNLITRLVTSNSNALLSDYLLLYNEKKLSFDCSKFSAGNLFTRLFKPYSLFHINLISTLVEILQQYVLIWYIAGLFFLIFVIFNTIESKQKLANDQRRTVSESQMQESTALYKLCHNHSVPQNIFYHTVPLTCLLHVTVQCKSSEKMAFIGANN